jgi:hypothetical protein
VQAIEEKKAAVSRNHRGYHRLFVWIGIPLVLLCVAGAVSIIMAGRIVRSFEPEVKARVVQSLGQEFGGRVILDRLEISVIRGLEVQGNGLRIYSAEDTAEAAPPVIEVRSFDLSTSWMQAALDPLHVGLVYVHGLQINIPPPQMRKQPMMHRGGFEKGSLRIDHVICDESSLTVNSANPAKSPKFFELKRIEFRNVGGDDPAPFDALMINAIPVGEIHSWGNFGPWDKESPADSNISGNYVFDHADLNPIKGIGGVLHSTGSYGGPLDRIEVQGKADVPNFSLDTANRPIPLETEFSAVVDGTSGDTYLHTVKAKLGSSPFSCKGSITHEKGKGHIIDLDVDVPHGRVEDFLALSIKTRPTVLTGFIQTRSHIHIRPGKESVTQKLDMAGGFSLTQIHFTNPQVEDKVDMLSLRARGKADLAKPGAADVQSKMTGKFTAKAGQIAFEDLNYTLPGADINLNGQYSMDGQTYEFTGKARTKAQISQMVDSKWKSILLKPIDPFFHKNGAGAEIPIKISGTKGEPHFGLKFGKDKDDNSKGQGR